MKKQGISARRVVITSFVVDLGDVFLNLTTALITGSMVVFTEALQGFADLLTSGLLWLGLKRSRRRPNRQHKFGFGKELFFWILMAGVSMFVLTAGFSLYFGFKRFLDPEPIENVRLAYAVLLIGLSTNFYAFRLSLKRLNIHFRDGVGEFWRRIRESPLIETKATTILDSMGTAASALGLVALAVYGITGDARFDGLGAIVVGLCCAVFAWLLIFEVKDFIVGRSASPELEERIKLIAQGIKGVHGVLDLRTMQMGSERVMVNMEVHIDHRLTTPAIEKLMDDLKLAVRDDVPEVQHIQVEVETPRRAVSSGIKPE